MTGKTSVLNYYSIHCIVDGTYIWERLYSNYKYIETTRTCDSVLSFMYCTMERERKYILAESGECVWCTYTYIYIYIFFFANKGFLNPL
jgi:hypothetical protein